MEILIYFLSMSFQVPLLSASIVGYIDVGKAETLDATKRVIISVDIRVECIDEERTGLGIGDFADVTFLDNDLKDITILPLGPYEVIRIDNSKSAVLRAKILSNKGSQIAEQFITQIKAGKATIKKVRKLRYYTKIDLMMTN